MHFAEDTNVILLARGYEVTSHWHHGAVADTWTFIRIDYHYEQYKIWMFGGYGYARNK